MKNKKMIVYVLVVLVVIVVLVFITINKKESSNTVEQQIGTIEQNMDTNNLKTEKIQGVTITVLKEGNGEIAKAGDTVAMNYTGTFVDGTAFDSNVDPKFSHVQPFTFTLGAGQVIQGWDIGVAGMKVGEKRKLEIEPEYGYGSTGAGATIPPNTKLNFEVELLEIIKK